MVNADVGAANVVVLGSEVGYYLPVLLVAGEGREKGLWLEREGERRLKRLKWIK